MTPQEIKVLSDEIIDLRNAYYQGNPKISDYSFDKKYDFLKSVAPNDPAIISVGAEVEDNSEWEKIEHQIPAGSLEKIDNDQDMEKWIKDNFPKSSGICFSEKIDGCSLSLSYDNGRLISAATRGNGSVGQNIYRNAIKIQGVIQQLPNDFSGTIRGEVLLKKSVRQEHFSDALSVRNMATGIALRLDGEACDLLNFFAYDVVGSKDFQIKWEQLEWLKNECGFQTPFYSATDNGNYFQFVKTIFDEYKNGKRDGLDYDIDGAVIQINNLKLFYSLGSTSNRPKGGKAWKFDSETAETITEKVFWQTGAGGSITPLAQVAPVEVSGAIIRNISLYNPAYVKELQVDVGAKVLISRKGDIIPRIEEVIQGTGTVAQIPTNCPSCGATTIMNGERLTCPNKNGCPAQVIGQITNFINGFGILEFGDKLVEKLVKSGFVKDPGDLFSLSLEQLLSIDRMGKKSATNCLKSLSNSKKVPLQTFLGSLSIPQIGSASIKLLIENGYDTLEKILAMSKNSIERVEGFGPVKAECLFLGLQNKRPIIDKLLSNGVSIKYKVEGKLTGMFICITGSTNLKRAELQKIIANNGGNYVGHITKSCTHLIIADPQSKTSKAVEAREAGVKLISETEFFEMIA